MLRDETGRHETHSSLRMAVQQGFMGCIGLYETGKWRRGWDSNPRDGKTAYTLSKRAPSTTRPPLQQCHIQRLSECWSFIMRTHIILSYKA